MTNPELERLALWTGIAVNYPNVAEAQFQGSRGTENLDTGWFIAGSNYKHVIVEGPDELSFLGHTAVLGVNKNTYKVRYAFDCFWKLKGDGAYSPIATDKSDVAMLLMFQRDMIDRWLVAVDIYWAGYVVGGAYTVLKIYLDEAELPEMSAGDSLVRVRMWVAIEFRQT